MPTFDPHEIRKAVAEFTPRRPQKFQDLIPAKEVIAELRQKRASYRAVADLLTQHCLPTSKTAIAAFCHQVLGEAIRPRRRPGRKRPPISASQTKDEAFATEAPQTTDVLVPPEPAAPSNGSESAQNRTRGPRIAQVRMLKPQNP